MPSPVILVVEDHPLLRLAAIDMVEDAGFLVIEAANSAEAIEILENRPDVRIVFTDVDMPPGIDGVRLAALIRDRWPLIQLILTSDHRTPPAETLPRDSVFYSKPYRETEVVATMRSMLA